MTPGRRVLLVASAFVVVLVVVAVVLVVVVRSDDGGADDDLSARVQTAGGSETGGVIAVDLDAGREVLGLGGGDLGDAEPRDLVALVAALPHERVPQASAMRDAIDLDQISAAATSLQVVGPASVTVIATEQSFDDIAEALLDAGYERDGDVLTYPDDDLRTSGLSYSALAGRDGLVAMSGAPDGGAELVMRALDDPEAEVEYLDALEGPSRGLLSIDSDCVDAIGVQDPLDGQVGAIVFFSDDPDAVDVRLDDQSFIGIDLDEPSVEGDRVVVPATGAQPGTVVAAVLGGEIQLDSILTCG